MTVCSWWTYPKDCVIVHRAFLIPGKYVYIYREVARDDV